MKECRQCGRNLDESAFRKTKSRSTGKYKTTQGSSTICKDCESLNIRAHKALQTNNSVAINKLKKHYELLESMGFPPITAAAKRLMGYDFNARGGTERNSLLITLTGVDAEVLAHANKVRNRGYSSFDEADKTHKALCERLKEAGLYEEINDLMDEWYMDE